MPKLQIIEVDDNAETKNSKSNLLLIAKLLYATYVVDFPRTYPKCEDFCAMNF